MTVRDLIIELLNRDIDKNIDFDISSDEEEINESDFEINESRGHVTISLQSKDYVLIDKNEYRDLHARIEELENK